MQQNQWNDAYENGRDYLGLTTQQIVKLLSYVNIENSDGPPTLLDIGCGTGQLVREMFHRGFKSLGIDSSHKAIEIAKQSTKYLGDDINFSTDDISALPESTFSIITCKYVAAFIPNLTVFLSHVEQHIAVDGVFVIITPQLDALSEEKKFIAIDDDVLSAHLGQYFAHVSKIRLQGDWWYICKK